MNSRVTRRFVTVAFVGVLLGYSILMACGKSETSGDLRTVRVAGIVLKWFPGDRVENFARIEPLIREAAEKGANIVCTAESFLDGYSVRDPAMTPEQFHLLAEPIPDGDGFVRLRFLADELDIYIVAAVTERDGDRIYNSAALIGPDGSHMGTYRKKFLWPTETDLYSAGDSFPTFDTEFGKIGMMICSDRREPEAIKALVANGAEVIFCPAGGGFGEENDQMVAERSKEGKVPIVFVHPAEFLVTGASGEVLKRNLFGETHDYSPDDSVSGVVGLYDLKLPTGVCLSQADDTITPAPKRGTAEWVVDMYFRQPSFPELRDYVTGERSGPSWGESIRPGVRVSYRLLESKPDRRIFAIESTSDSSHVDLYCYLSLDEGQWKISAVMSLALTGVFWMLLEECEKDKSVNDTHGALCGKARLMISGDTELKQYLIDNIDKFNELVSLCRTVSVNEDTIPDRSEKADERPDAQERRKELLDELYLDEIVHISPNGEIHILLGGMVDNQILYFYLPNDAKPPQMSPNDYIYVERIIPNWFLIKTT